MPCPLAQVVQPAGKVSAKVEEERKDESPASWRLGLRKTGSYGALAEITATKEAQREKDTTGVMRSASSPRLSSSLDNKDKEKVRSDETFLGDFFFILNLKGFCVSAQLFYSYVLLILLCVGKG